MKPIDSTRVLFCRNANVWCVCMLLGIAGIQPLQAADSISRPQAEQRALNERKKSRQPAEEQSPKSFRLPPVPAGVTELKFSEFFVFPVGRRGLELTPKVKELNGQKIRILGFMAQQETPTPGVFLLTPQPAHQNQDTCLVDDLPPCTLRVLAPHRAADIIPFTSQPMLLTGILSVGNKLEPDGHVSMMRLTLEQSKDSHPQPKLRFSAERGATRLLR